MKFKYLWPLFFAILLYASCKKEDANSMGNDAITNVEDSPNYYFGKYHPSCGIVPPCSDWFWLINKEGLVQIGDIPENVFTLRDSLGQIDETHLNSFSNLTYPISNELDFDEIGSIINQATTIHSSCYTFDNATAVLNFINYFVLIPLANNRFQVVNLTICQGSLPATEQQAIDDILDWLAMVDEQIGG